jgi:hypothetical protein
VGLDDGGLELTGSAHEGADAVSCRAVLAADRTLASLELAHDEPPGPVDDDGGDGGGGGESVGQVGSLVGRVVGRGFRAAVDEVCEPGSLRSVLLTELPVVALLSGYGTLYSGHLPAPLSDQFVGGLPVDICAGWAAPGSMVVHIRTRREIPTPDGPSVPADTEGWHPMPSLATGALRRQRLIERSGNEVWAMFRDSYARPDGVTSVLHEYTVTATVDGDGDGLEGGGGDGDGDGVERVTACTATPRVLPWAECPQAAASAGRLVGRPLSDLRRLVRDDLVGTSTCTHLNDLLSTLSQAGRLV